MAEKEGKRSWLVANRAPVVAEVLGFEHGEPLTLGRAVAGLKAQKEDQALNPLLCQRPFALANLDKALS
jgi:hypothetical protein